MSQRRCSRCRKPGHNAATCSPLDLYAAPIHESDTFIPEETWDRLDSFAGALLEVHRWPRATKAVITIHAMPTGGYVASLLFDGGPRRGRIEVCSVKFYAPDGLVDGYSYWHQRHPRHSIWREAHGRVRLNDTLERSRKLAEEQAKFRR